MLAVANQKPGLLEQYGITRAEADRSAWTIEPDGRRLQGAAAINRVMRELGGVWRAGAAAYRLAPVAAAEEAFYRWFARHRSTFHRLGVQPECDEPGAGCI